MIQIGTAFHHLKGLFSDEQSDVHTPDTLKRAVRGIVVVLIALALTVFIPGFIAFHDGVFYDTDVRLKLPTEASGKLSEFEGKKTRVSRNLTRITDAFDNLENSQQQKESDFYGHLIDQRQKEISVMKPPIFTIGFFLSPQMLLWPAIYASLGCLLFCFGKFRRRKTKDQGFRIRLICLTALIYVYYEWPLWARNFLLGSHGRTVYSYTNFDIDKSSFFAQEATIAGFALLLASVWMRWTYLAEIQQRVIHSEKVDGYFNLTLMAEVQKEFVNWINNSIILGLGFAYFTSFFWNLVAGYHDDRYILSAFLAHSLWILTWIFVSMPLLKSWGVLRERRLEAIGTFIQATVAESIPGKAERLNLESLEKLESLAGVRISLAGAGALISLVLPILQLFFHKG